jgi:hypothetical protein
VFFPVGQAQGGRMLSATECRARATEAFARAARSTNPYAKLNWQGRGQEWVSLAVHAEAEEAAEREFLDRNPN